MTIETIKEIEEHINFLLETYDLALTEKNYEIVNKTLEVIDYELNKLDKNEVKLSSETFLN